MWVVPDWTCSVSIPTKGLKSFEGAHVAALEV